MRTVADVSALVTLFVTVVTGPVPIITALVVVFKRSLKLIGSGSCLGIVGGVGSLIPYIPAVFWTVYGAYYAAFPPTTCFTPYVCVQGKSPDALSFIIAVLLPSFLLALLGYGIQALVQSRTRTDLPKME